MNEKSAVVTGNLFEANIPPTTISPLPIAIRVIMTCKIVKAPTDIPRIMEVSIVARSLAEHHFGQLQQGFATGGTGARL
jgi:hypothetical protein